MFLGNVGIENTSHFVELGTRKQNPLLPKFMNVLTGIFMVLSQKKKNLYGSSTW